MCRENACKELISLDTVIGENALQPIRAALPMLTDKCDCVGCFSDLVVTTF